MSWLPIVFVLIGWKYFFGKFLYYILHPYFILSIFVGKQPVANFINFTTPYYPLNIDLTFLPLD